MSTITRERLMTSRELDAEVAARAREILASVPPLTAEQRAEIAAIVSRGAR
jgi:hypothetical protein